MAFTWACVTGTVVAAGGPHAPTDLKATAVSPIRVDLVWQDNSNDETAFVIERRTGESGVWLVAWAQNNANFPSFSDMGLEPGTRFSYRVKARTKDGRESAPSNVTVVTTPSGPAAFNNLLRDRLATSSSFQWRKVPPYQAVDGTQWTRWWSKLSPENAPRVDWLCVDMGFRRTVARTRLIWQRDWWARKYEVQISDDAREWRPILQAENASFRGIDDRSFPPAAGRYLRFVGLESANRQKTWGGFGSYSLYEFQAYAPGVDADPLEWESLALDKPVSATTRPELARGAVDGHMGTFWSARHGRENSLTVDFGTVREINRIQPIWHVPVDAYAIRLSGDGETWRTVADQSTVERKPVENEEIHEVHTALFAMPERARLVRLVVTGKAVSADPNFAQIILQELLVHGR